MRVTYDSQADVLCVLFRNVPPVDAVEEPEGVIISDGADGEPVSVEFLNAKARDLVDAGEVSVTVGRRSLGQQPAT